MGAVCKDFIDFNPVVLIPALIDLIPALIRYPHVHCNESSSLVPLSFAGEHNLSIDGQKIDGRKIGGRKINERQPYEQDCADQRVLVGGISISVTSHTKRDCTYWVR